MDNSQVNAALDEWNRAREPILAYNAAVSSTVAEIERLRRTLDESQLSSLQSELKALKVAKRRHDADVVALVTKLETVRKRKGEIASDRERLRTELNEHGRAIAETLGRSINGYLRRLSAGFRIDYQAPDYRGKEPAASYQILINELPVSPRSGKERDKPSFRNTLSAGDKSVLALAFFLARVNAEADLPKTIVVLDDPFTSLDQFRRQFTAIEIRNLSYKAAQTVVLSHDKWFLRLLWEKLDHSIISSIALQTGVLGMSTIAPYNIPDATQPRHVTERMKISEFADGEDYDMSYIRTRLRTVCEDFYRRGDPELSAKRIALRRLYGNYAPLPRGIHIEMPYLT